jgi:hypothetical protein
VRAPLEPIDEGLKRFYEKVLVVLRERAMRDGEWRLLECVPAWDGNWTSEGFVAFAWQRGDTRMLVVVNYAGNQGQCYVRVPFADLAGRTIHLHDLFNDARYERAGNDLAWAGLYVDLPSWGYHVFDVEAS